MAHSNLRKYCAIYCLLKKEKSLLQLLEDAPAKFPLIMSLRSHLAAHLTQDVFTYTAFLQSFLEPKALQDNAVILHMLICDMPSENHGTCATTEMECKYCTRNKLGRTERKSMC